MKFCSKYMMLSLLILAPNLWPWGFVGHRAVASIAEHHLTPTTHIQLKKIQHDESLQQLSIWPDTIRLYYPHTTTWHYTALSPHATQPPHRIQGQLYQQLCHHTQILIHRNQYHWQKQHQALSWVIHLVGDAHQPLHIGNGQDKGANTCKVLWFKRKKPTNLHKVWDNFLVKATLRRHPHLQQPDLPQTVLRQSPLAWMRTARQLHTRIYLPHPHQYCQPKNTFLKNNLPILKQPYVNKMMPNGVPSPPNTCPRLPSRNHALHNRPSRSVTPTIGKLVLLMGRFSHSLATSTQTTALNSSPR